MDMNEKPMLFNTEMVQAILDGRKAQTRREVKIPDHLIERQSESLVTFEDEYGDQRNILTVCPFGKVGDHLWVRETHHFNHNKTMIHYKADYNGNPFNIDTCGEDCSLVGEKWRPSIHMPRWASRITLEITDIRVERLQDISEEDAVKEGCLTNNQYSDKAGEENLWPCEVCNGYQTCGSIDHQTLGACEIDCNECDTPKKRFSLLWNSIYQNWNENPWVWVVEFKAL
jgi:hypothetical protein